MAGFGVSQFRTQRILRTDGQLVPESIIAMGSAALLGLRMHGRLVPESVRSVGSSTVLDGGHQMA